MDKDKSSAGADWERHVVEGQGIISKVSQLKYEMARDRELKPIESDGGPDVTGYNEALIGLANAGKGTWFTAPWLYAEYGLLLYERPQAIDSHL